MGDVNRRAGCWLALALALALVGAAAPARAQDAEAPKEAAPAPSVDEQRKAVEAELAAIPEAPADPALAERRELLVRLEHALGQHLNELRRGEDLAVQAEKAKQALSAPVAETLGEPPYSLGVYDEAEVALGRARTELAQLERAVSTARASVANARLELEAKEKARRVAKEAGRDDLPQLAAESRLARAALALREAELANTVATLDIQRQRLARARAVSERARAGLEVGVDDEREALAELDRDEAGLRRRLERAELGLQEAKARWQAAQAGAGRVGEAQLAALRSQLSTRQKDVALLSEAIDRVGEMREVIRRRIAVLGGDSPDRSVLRGWQAEAVARIEELDRDRSLDLAEITALEQELQELVKRAGAAGAAPALATQAESLRARIDLHRENLSGLERARGLEIRLRGELEREVGAPTVRDRLRRLGEQARAAWGYELFASGDQPVTVGKLVLALALIVVGLIVANRVARLSEQRLLPRFGFDPGASHAFAALGFYVLLVGVVLLALRTVNIPLTAFAILGGAVAIGVGFGSQNIVNNFISGIILLAERPIKVGDLIQVEETYGNVERIGLRSTRVRTGENIHIILPNSALLENRVVNWTHNDSSVRIKLMVGIVYGSPTRRAEELLRKAILEHPRVRPKPDPIILFMNFGDNSLDFQCHFWVAVRSYMDRLSIESDVRYRIDELFREEGIVIAFPQRDVHLDSAAPLEIRLVGDDAPTPKETE